MDQVLQTVSDNASVAHYVEGCKWMQNLNIPAMRTDNSEIANFVIEALKLAARKCSEGLVVCEVDGRTLDTKSQKQFQVVTGELAEMLETG